MILNGLCSHSWRYTCSALMMLCCLSLLSLQCVNVDVLLDNESIQNLDSYTVQGLADIETPPTCHNQHVRQISKTTTQLTIVPFLRTLTENKICMCVTLYHETCLPLTFFSLLNPIATYISFYIITFKYTYIFVHFIRGYQRAYRYVIIMCKVLILSRLICTHKL